MGVIFVLISWVSHLSLYLLLISLSSHSKQRRRQHFKSSQGQATANKRSLVHVHGGGYPQQGMCGSEDYL